MFLSANYPKPSGLGFPRVCGDVSIARNGNVTAERLSPRMRGCFRKSVSQERLSNAFPAYAGMFPSLFKKFLNSLGFPRVCGDVSIVRKSLSSYSLLSPRMRGCFQRLHARRADYPAFPAYAGMFPCFSAAALLFSGFPRVCGDVSNPKAFDSEHS